MIERVAQHCLSHWGLHGLCLQATVGIALQRQPDMREPTWPTATLSLQHSNEDERNAAWLMEIAGHTVNVLAEMRRAPDEVDTLPFWGLVDYVELEEFVAWAEERMQREAGPRLRSIAGEWRHAARTQRYFEGKGKKGWKGKGKGGKGRGPGGRASHSWQGWQWQGQGWQ